MTPGSVDDAILDPHERRESAQPTTRRRHHGLQPRGYLVGATVSIRGIEPETAGNRVVLDGIPADTAGPRCMCTSPLRYS